MKTIDFSFVSLKNLKHFLYNINGSLSNDLFTIFINNKQFSIPIELAICFSNKILSILETDNTIRQFEININVKNEQLIEKIIDIFTDNNGTISKLNLESREDIYDIILISQAFGYDLNHTDLKQYFQEEIKNINKENAFELLSVCQQLGHFDIVEQILDFISIHFHLLAKQDSFIEWCSLDTHYNYVERIITNHSLQLKDENQLLEFIIKICKNNSLNESLLEYVYLEYCNTKSIQIFIDYINENKKELQDHQMKTIFSCISRRLLQSKLPLPIIYSSHRYFGKIIIGSNNGNTIPSKYIEQINDKTFKLYYPSENSSSCETLFKVSLTEGFYKLECIGASGGKGNSHEGGFGGYSCGVLEITKFSDLFLFIGGQGSNISGENKAYSLGGFNGGGRGCVGSSRLNAGSGGGATDIRLNSTNLEDRIIVAGGGGGSAGYDTNGRESIGGNGGGINGSNGSSAGSSHFGTGGSQNQEGISNKNSAAQPGNKNKGGDGCGGGSSGGGGGGGYYGGGGGYIGGGGGGSGYVSNSLQSYKGITKETKEYNNIGNGYVIITIL